jgi:hypothetical protein
MGIEIRLQLYDGEDKKRIDLISGRQGLDRFPDLASRSQGARKLGGPFAGPRGAAGQRQGRGDNGAPQTARNTTEAFCPPKPRLLLSTVRTFTSRATFGT